MDDSRPNRRDFIAAVATTAAIGSFADAVRGKEPQPAPTCGKLFAIGGYVGNLTDKKPDDKSEFQTFDPPILAHRFAQACKGGSLKGKTVIVAITATGGDNYEDTEANLQTAARRYSEDFEKLGAARIIIVDSNILQNHDALVDILEDKENTAAIFFGGGDQSAHMAAWEGTPELAALKKRFAEDKDFVIGGNSAGTAVMSETMITSEGSAKDGSYHDIYDRKGFGFTKITFETHADRIRTYTDENETTHEIPARAAKRITIAGGPSIALEEGVAALIEGNNIELVSTSKAGTHDKLKKGAHIIEQTGVMPEHYIYGTKLAFDGTAVTPQKNLSITP